MKSKPGDVMSPLRGRGSQTAALVCGVLLSASACSGSEGSEEPGLIGATLNATDVCSGTLSEARQDLEEMMGGERFRRAQPEVSLSTYLETLTEPGTHQEPFCFIRSDGHVAIHIDFGWERRAEAFEPSSPSISYAAGLLSYVHRNGSYMLLECPSPEGQEYPGAGLRATMGTGADEMDPDLQMSVLAAAARDVAEGLGCLEEAGLPEGTPERVEKGAGN